MNKVKFYICYITLLCILLFSLTYSQSRERYSLWGAAKEFKIPKGFSLQIPLQNKIIEGFNKGNNLSSQTLFSEGFETGIGSWTILGNVWEVGAPTSGPMSAHSGNNVAATVLAGNYPDYADAFLISPSVNLPNVTGIILSFWHWFKTESRYDYCYVLITTDNGLTWQQLKSYNGSSGVWLNERIDLSTYRNQMIKIGFYFHSDYSITYEGWYIDDIAIEILTSGDTLNWTALASMPTPRAWAPAVVWDGKIYVVGGCSSPTPQQFYNAVATLEVYDPSNNFWESLPSMSMERVGPAAAALNGKIYVMGGFNRSTWSANTSVEIYDIATRTWTSGPPMPIGVSWAKAVTLENKIYVLGGVGAHYYNTVQVFDPQTNSWSIKSPFNGGRYLHAAVVYNGKIYLIGGDTWETGNDYVYSDIQVYDPTSDSWTEKSPMPFAATGLEAVAINDKIHVFGNSPLYLVYDINSDTWQLKYSTHSPEGAFSMVNIDSVIYRFGGGGWGPTVSIVEKAEIFLSPPSISNYRIIFNQINSSSFPVIDCYVSVVDSSGQPVSNLTSSNFQVFEDGYSEQFSLTPITGVSVPISVALIIDRSGSMGGQPINDAKNAALIFVDSLRAGDRAAVISFNNQVTVDQPFTSDKNLLRSAINSIYAGGLTAIYNAAYTALSLISSEPSQRKAIILLTDGADNSSSISVDSVINYANFLNVPIYTIGLGLTPGSSEEQVLIRIAQSTGGNYYYSPTSSQLGQIYRSISSQIQNQYKLTYTTHNPNFDGSLRTVKIIVLYQSSVDSATKTYRAPLAGSWFIQLSATSGNLGDVYNFAGVHHSASDSFDIYDVPEPPSPNSNYIQLYFPHPNWNHILGPYFSKDVRLSRVLKVQTITWDFEVKTDLVNSTITLRVIPDSLVPSDYLIVLEDVDAGVKTIINENNTYTYNSGQGGVRHFKLVVGKLFISTSFNAGWNLAGFPILPDSSKFSSILNDDIGSYYYIYSYLPDVGYYLDTSIQVGKGFWLGILNDAIIDVYGQSMPDSFEVSLNKQWNIISVPFTSDLEKSSLLFNRGGVVVNFDSATSLGWISPVLYGYARTNYFISDTLKPWKGYWLGAIVDSLKLIYIKGTTTPTPRIAFDKIVSLNNWNVYIRVNANNISDNAFFGVKADGSDQFDAKYDYPKPPFPPNTMSFIQVYFAHPEWNLVLGNNFMSDVKSPSSMIWEFTVEHNISNPTELVLQWDIGEVPNDVNLILTDLKTGSSVDMRGRSEIKFTENPGVKRLFKVSGTIVNVEKDNLIPKEFALYQNYPNPFNPETIIEFNIPKRTFVKLTIYDILGREIKVLINEEINPGKYAVKFNASNLPSGIYFYRLDAGEFSDIKKMVFVK